MQHIIIEISIQYSDGRPAKLEEMNAKELKKLRFSLLAEAGRIEQKIYEMTGKIIDD